MSPSYLQAPGLSADRLQRLYDRLAEAVETGRIPSAAMQISRHGVPIAPRYFGRRTRDPGSPHVDSDTRYLVASITKPVTVAAAMLLVERGALALDDRAKAYIPEFGQEGKSKVRIRHLMTHTSGLPDMLPEDRDFRKKHLPLPEFVERACSLPLTFTPGTSISYQSMGIAMLAAIIERVVGMPLADFLRGEIFEPPGMTRTSLGIAEEHYSQIAEIGVGEEMEGQDWGWNSAYWRTFASPWGGIFSTANDITRFSMAFSTECASDANPVFSQATVAAMIRDQTSLMPKIGRAMRLREAWGLGWRIVTGHEVEYFGNLLSLGSFGHGGATGTVAWVDPESELTFVLLTAQPTMSMRGVLGRFSNMAAAAAL